MTLHSDVNYKCEACGAAFIPLVKLQKCPQCGHEAPEAFEYFVHSTVRSALYNLSYGSFLPMIWGTFTTGDSYYDAAFRFLHYATRQQDVRDLCLSDGEIPPETARRVAEQYVHHVATVDPDYIKDTMQDFFSRVLIELKADGRQFVIRERKKSPSVK
jgi:hypothetical protein